MQIEEGPFFIIRDYRKIVTRAKNEKRKDQSSKTAQFTTHQSIPQDVKDEINQILFQLTQPPQHNGQNIQKMTQNDEDYNYYEYYCYGRYNEEKREEDPQEITDIEHFLSLEQNETF